MKDFCDTYVLKRLITQPTCFKNAQNTTCINLIMTKGPKSFQNPLCNLYDYHKITVTVVVIENFPPQR